MFSLLSVTCRILLNIQVKLAAYYKESLLGLLISAYISHDDRNMVILATFFLKRIRVRVIHIIRKNRKGREIPRVKNITGLATPGDGHGLQQPPNRLSVRVRV